MVGVARVVVQVSLERRARALLLARVFVYIRLATGVLFLPPAVTFLVRQCISDASIWCLVADCLLSALLSVFAHASCLLKTHTLF